MTGKPLFLLFIISSWSSLLLSQSANVSAGGNASSGSGSVSFSVGQVVCSVYSTTLGTIITGVQQPYEISVVTSSKGAEDIMLEGIIYPNPVSDLLTLKIPEFDYKTMSFKIFNINGDLLKESKIIDGTTYISMSEFKSGTYFLRIVYNNMEIKTFKIIKN